MLGFFETQEYGFKNGDLTSQGLSIDLRLHAVARHYKPSTGGWRPSTKGNGEASMKADRVSMWPTGSILDLFKIFFDDFSSYFSGRMHAWMDIGGGATSRI